MDIIEKLNIITQRITIDKEYLAPGFPEIMTDVDIELNKLVREYLLIPTEERDNVKSSISIDNAWLLLAFSEDMATYALRQSEQELFSNGLTALSMVYGILDAREIMVIMVLYCDVNKRIGLSFESIINEGGDFGRFIEGFINRDESDKSLESMGYTLEKDEQNNLLYQRAW